MKINHLRFETFHGEEKHIFIFVRCRYTLEGIISLCERYAGWRICGIPENTKELKTMLLRHPVDLVIVDSQVAKGNIQALMCLPDIIEGRRLLLCDNQSLSIREAYLAAGYDAVVSKNIRIALFDTLLRHLVDAGRNERLPVFYRQLYKPNEKKVLLRLLQGQLLKDIADDIGVSHSTACRLKKRVLTRMGFNNLHEMLLSHRSPHESVS